MTGSPWDPVIRADGSLNAPAGWEPPVAAGDGVAGTAGAGAAVEGAGAGGAAGVEATALDGVEGACEGVAADEEVLGYSGKLGQSPL